MRPQDFRQAQKVALVDRSDYLPVLYDERKCGLASHDPLQRLVKGFFGS
jgi:hypothetical protein